MKIPEPYVEWFYFDEDEWCYKLTEEAPKKAKRSCEEFYEKLGGYVE